MATSGRNTDTGEGLPAAELPPVHVPEDTLPFTQPWDFGDVSFIIEGRKLYVNRTTLAMSSEVFRAMFTSDFKEKKMTEIPLPDKMFDDFLQLMQILHPQINKLVNDTNVNCILPLAHEYQIPHLMERCVKTLLDQPPSIHNLILADKFSLPELRQVCLQYAKRAPHHKLQMDPEYKMVEKDTLFEIFQHKSEVYEGNDPSKISCNLMAQPPSILNFLQAQKYDMSDVYEKCLIFLIDTPLKQLKREPGFTNLKPDSLIAVLNYKINMLEDKQTEVGVITSWGGLNLNEICSCREFTGFHMRGTNRSCPECTEYICTSGSHQRGTNRDCSGCKLYRFNESSGIVKKY